MPKRPPPNHPLDGFDAPDVLEASVPDLSVNATSRGAGGGFRGGGAASGGAGASAWGISIAGPVGGGAVEFWSATPTPSIIACMH